MLQHNYYSIDSLALLQQENHELFLKMLEVTRKVYLLFQGEGFSLPSFDTLAGCLDLMDALADLLHDINSFFKRRFGRTFFRKINNYGCRQTKIRIGVALYMDTVSMQ